MDAIAVDMDANTLLQLRHLPADSRLFFPPIDPHYPSSVGHTIHIEDVMAHIKRADTVHIDAILLCCGLGGTMIDAISIIIPEIRNAFTEPLFAIATLPCLGEGMKRSAKAAKDIDILQRMVDAIILFDNETQVRRLEKREDPVPPEKGGIRDAALSRSSGLPKNPRDVYAALNDRISRQVGLLLRAGEFNERGLEVAEVVLDAGEVLNTLKGMGIVAVGYAAEELPYSFADTILGRWRSSSYFIENSQRKASRIVSLAKRAVYDEMSVPCDLTSAEKALVLIAGPSHELSMRGFQTIRKWIDRSIAGLEMRSGDYPVRNTRFVGIVIVLSGLSNVPRINDLRSIRTQYLSDASQVSDLEKVPLHLITVGEAQIEPAQEITGNPAPVKIEDAAPVASDLPGSEPQPPAPVSPRDLLEKQAEGLEGKGRGDRKRRDAPKKGGGSGEERPSEGESPVPASSRRRKRSDDPDGDGLIWIR
jgi:tubulin-like protein CetZ